MFELVRNSEVPLVDQICERVTQLVRHGQLSPGTRLPWIRRLARQVSASPFTVVDAYDRLVARGVIESRAGRGFFVTPRRLSAPLVAIEGLADPGAGASSSPRAGCQHRSWRSRRSRPPVRMPWRSRGCVLRTRPTSSPPARAF